MSRRPSTIPVHKAARKADLIIHPVRLRIIQAFAAGQQLPAQQVFALLPDVPQPSLYRHLKTLVDGGVLALVEAPPVRSFYAKLYTLAPAPTHGGPADRRILHS